MLVWLPVTCSALIAGLLLAPSLGLADSFARHVGAQDPLGQGWVLHAGDPPNPGVSAGPVPADSDDLAAWFVNDSSTASGSRLRYEVAPVSSADRLAGWTLRGVLRLVNANDPNDASVLLEVADGSRRWLVTFGSSGGTPNVTLSGGGSAQVTTASTLGAASYHLYELAWDPIPGVAELYVDGSRVLADWPGVASSLDRLHFGGGSSGGTGNGRYALVELLLGPQACRDGVDNDGDGLVDFEGGDPDCQSALDPHEEAALDSDFDGSSDAEEAAAGSDPLLPDTDGDGLGDRFEIANGFDPLAPGEQTGDPDGDGLDNAGEEAAGSDPQRADTDGDGLSDADEVNLHETDPAAVDSDGDGLGDDQELAITLTDPNAADTDGDGLDDLAELLGSPATDPLLADTDGDGLGDGAEIDEQGTDPQLADSDGDGLADGIEVFEHGTDPLLADTDGDGLGDAFEVAGQLDPTTPGEQSLDPDGDGLDNLGEQSAGSDPQRSDTDGDGLSDGAELSLHATSPVLADTDGDGLEDGVELSQGLDPRFADAGRDPDVDGLSSLREVEIGTDPLLADTDGDGLPDGDEANILGSDPLDPASSGVELARSTVLVFEAHDQPLFSEKAADPNLFFSERISLIEESNTGDAGQIQQVNQQVPLWAAQQAWEQAIATCDNTTYNFTGTPSFCGPVTVNPTATECETGVANLDTRSASCCATCPPFSSCILAPTGTFPGCGIFTTASFSLSDVPGAPSTYSIPGGGIGPRPTQPPPPEPFALGAEIHHEVSVRGDIVAELDLQDAGLVDLQYRTEASLRSSRTTVAAGETFSLWAEHRPTPESSQMQSSWPATAFTLDYEFRVDALVTGDYALLDPATGQQQTGSEVFLNETVIETGELFRARAGLLDGLELRFMEGVPYVPPAYQGLVFQVLEPPPPGIGVDFGFTLPPTCPTSLLAFVPPCTLLEAVVASIDLAGLRFQIPDLSSPAGEDFEGGAVALNSAQRVVPQRGALEPDGSLVNTLPSRYRPVTNLTNDADLFEALFRDETSLSGDLFREKIDLDGLLSLATSGAFLAGINLGSSNFLGLSVDVLDSNAVLWLSYDQRLSFSPNLVADVSFPGQTLQVSTDGGQSFTSLPAGQSIELAVLPQDGAPPAALAGLPTELQVVQPPGGVQAEVSYSFRRNRFENETYPLWTLAWQNTYMQAALTGLIPDLLEEAQIPVGFQLLRATLQAGDPAQGARMGGSDPLSGLVEDFPGASFTVLDLALDQDGDGLPDALEALPGVCSLSGDADSDDDGLPDALEDGNRNGLRDPGETDPCLADSDGDGFQDGAERGLQTAVTGDTDPAVFLPSADPGRTSDPNDPSSTPADGAAPVPALGPTEQLFLAALLGAVAALALRAHRRRKH